MIKAARTHADFVTEFAEGQIGSNNYYVFSFPTAQEGLNAENKFRSAFREVQAQCALPRRAEDITVDFVGGLPGFGTAFREGGKVLLVRTNKEPEADGLVFKHLGKADYRVTL
jgi:hypothetical protein